MDPRAPAVERAHFEGVASRRPELYWADRTAAGRRRREIRAALIAAAAAPTGAGTMLEIGCGNAEYTAPLSRHTGARVVGIDIVPEVLARARPSLAANVRLASADIEHLPFATGSFDAVVGNAVLHHLRLDRAIPELLRVLRRGGVFCFAEPNMLNPQVFLERTIPFVGRWLDNSPGETAFTRWRLRQHLVACGLVDVVVRPFDFLYPLTPERLIPAVERVGRWLERTPGVREIAGSLLVSARKR